MKIDIKKLVWNYNGNTYDIYMSKPDSDYIWAIKYKLQSSTTWKNIGHYTTVDHAKRAIKRYIEKKKKMIENKNMPTSLKSYIQKNKKLLNDKHWIDMNLFEDVEEEWINMNDFNDFIERLNRIHKNQIEMFTELKELMEKAKHKQALDYYNKELDERSRKMLDNNVHPQFKKYLENVVKNLK